MSISPASRPGWHTFPPTGPGRTLHSQRRAVGRSAPVLTLTLSIPLVGEDEALPPAACRLLEAAQELLERGEGSMTAGLAPTDRYVESAAACASLARTPALRILAASRSVLRDGEPVRLTRLEFDLLLHLVTHPRRVFTRLQLLTAVWGYEHAGVRTVDVHIRRLRGKVGTDVPLVTTVYGIGYRLADDARVTIDRSA